MRRRDVAFAEVFFLDAPLAFDDLAPAFRETASGFFPRPDLVPDVGFAPVPPCWDPAPAGEAGFGFGLRRRRRRFRGGGSSEPAGMSSPAMTCG